MKACQQILERVPSDHDARMYLGANLFALGRLPEAEDAFAHLAEEHPQDFIAHFNLGLVIEFQGRHAESEAVYEDALQIAATDREVQTSAWHLGIAAYNLNDAASSLEWFKAAAALNPEDFSAWGFAAVSAAILDRKQDAVAFWTRALQAFPEYFVAYAPPAEKTMYEEVLGEVGPQPPAPIPSPDYVFTVRDAEW